jgi:hypothetical protein
MNGGERDCECCNITADIIRGLAQELRELEGPNSEVFDLADEVVIRGPSGEVERCLDGIRTGIDRHSDVIDAMLQRDDVKRREWMSAWEEEMDGEDEGDEGDEREGRAGEADGRDLGSHPSCSPALGGEARRLVQGHLGIAPIVEVAGRGT